MNSIRNLLFHAVLLVILTSSYGFPMYGKEDTSVVHIVRNVRGMTSLRSDRVLAGRFSSGFARQRNARHPQFLKAYEIELTRLGSDAERAYCARRFPGTHLFERGAS
jgi:hypothetical protein